MSSKDIHCRLCGSQSDSCCNIIHDFDSTPGNTCILAGFSCEQCNKNSIILGFYHINKKSHFTVHKHNVNTHMMFSCHFQLGLSRRKFISSA